MLVRHRLLRIQVAVLRLGGAMSCSRASRRRRPNLPCLACSRVVPHEHLLDRPGAHHVADVPQAPPTWLKSLHTILYGVWGRSAGPPPCDRAEVLESSPVFGFCHSLRARRGSSRSARQVDAAASTAAATLKAVFTWAGRWASNSRGPPAAREVGEVARKGAASEAGDRLSWVGGFCRSSLEVLRRVCTIASKVSALVS